MSVTVTLKLASGESLQTLPVELLSNGVPIAKTIVDENGHAVFNVVPAKEAQLAIRASYEPSEEILEERHP
jgi:hypothetical protein